MTTFKTGSRVSFLRCEVTDDGVQFKRRSSGTILKVSEYEERDRSGGKRKASFQYTVRDDDGHYLFLLERRDKMVLLESP